MSVIQVAPTSFWSMLPSITGQAIGQYQQSSDRNHAEQDRQRGILLQQLGILQSQAANGADVNGQISDLMSKLGMSGAQPAQTPAQLRQQIMNTPDATVPGMTPQVVQDGKVVGTAPEAATSDTTIKGIDRFTDQQRHLAGLQTSGEVSRDQAATSDAQLQTKINAIKSRAASGQPVSDYEASLAGINTPGQVGMENAGKVTDFVNKNADGYVKEWLLKNGGRIVQNGPKANTEQMIDQAFGSFMDRYGDKIPPQSATDARAAFAKSAYGVLQDQNDLDLKRQQMQLQYAIADLKKKSGAGVDPELSGKLVDQINRVADGLEKQQKDMGGANQSVFMAALMAGKKPQDMGALADSYTQFADVTTRLNAARSAAAGVARGLSSDPQVQHFLDIASGVDKAQADKPTGQQSTSPQPRAKDNRLIVSQQEKIQLQKMGKWNDSKFVVQ